MVLNLVGCGILAAVAAAGHKMTILTRAGWIFPRSGIVETVETALHFDGPPDQVWRAMLFYEDVPSRPSAFLRLFLPAPVRTSGDKTRVGASVQCTYEGGYLEKRMTAIEAPRRMAFDVTLQALGIEDAISMHGGAYDLAADEAGGTKVVLTTRYRGHFRPRWLWRPFERYLAHQLHRHILRGVRTAMPDGMA